MLMRSNGKININKKNRTNIRRIDNKLFKQNYI